MKRRDFLAGLAAGIFIAPQISRASISENIRLEELGEYPLAKTVERFRAQQKLLQSKSFSPTNLDKKEYLRLVNGIVTHFVQFQDERGAIIDPFEKKERQYSTPAFAFAAAVLYASGYNKNVLAQCMKAMDAATSDLRNEKTADKHSNFYTVMLMQAFDVLKKIAPQERLSIWQENLTNFSPATGYNYPPERETNWNLVAASGEWRRVKAGFTKDTTWLNTAIEGQQKLWTDYGMFCDANDPLAYDHFARYYIEDLLMNGYDGAPAKMLRELTNRGAWTSLFMQSPHGELPVGGRSGHHQWNEAQQTMSYEYYAAEYAKKGDKQTAGAFKRAARLALGSIGKWQKPTGELWIVKNRYESSQRFGYDSYSFHSQYNLLAAAKLSNAYLLADDSITETLTPSEIGGFAFVLQPQFHKVFANVQGMFVEIDTRSDPSHNPTGIVRVHLKDVNPQLTISDGATPKAAYGVPRKPTRALSISVDWQDGEGKWYSLAAHDRKVLRDAEVKIITQTAEKVELEIIYQGVFQGGATSIIQKISITPTKIMVTDKVVGNVKAVRAVFPLFLTDGREETEIKLSKNSVSVTGKNDDSQNFRVVSEKVNLTRQGFSEPFRNGLLDAAYGETVGQEISYIIEPKKAGKKNK